MTTYSVVFREQVLAAVFTAWVTQDLVPKLPPNSVVVMGTIQPFTNTQKCRLL
ncbi:MAG: hypothetical protein Q8Q56_05815 [Alphaproteobacteria bacterium]|nr:hypothetical protein [Alphaproteobacteria bacterium]